VCLGDGQGSASVAGRDGGVAAIGSGDGVRTTGRRQERGCEAGMAGAIQSDVAGQDRAAFLEADAPCGDGVARAGYYRRESDRLAIFATAERRANCRRARRLVWTV